MKNHFASEHVCISSSRSKLMCMLHWQSLISVTNAEDFEEIVQVSSLFASDFKGIDPIFI